MKRREAGARARPHRRARPRPGPKARPPRGRHPTDRLGIGAITLTAVVGLSLLAIAERALLDGGASGAVGSHHSMKSPEPGADTPAQPRRPSRRPPALPPGRSRPPASTVRHR
ncbi:hypothetical protein [Actinomadura formosensis]|uniref:hypothetical protein n=1 Tax=Actinomadura formosensis TaxID=60706 RepID=UPI0010419B7C|nr:hypothetical protein [Actinomadura formosensis]